MFKLPSIEEIDEMNKKEIQDLLYNIILNSNNIKIHKSFKKENKIKGSDIEWYIFDRDYDFSNYTADYLLDNLLYRALDGLVYYDIINMSLKNKTILDKLNNIDIDSNEYIKVYILHRLLQEYKKSPQFKGLLQSKKQFLKQHPRKKEYKGLSYNELFNLLVDLRNEKNKIIIKYPYNTEAITRMKGIQNSMYRKSKNKIEIFKGLKVNEDYYKNLDEDSKKYLELNKKMKDIINEIINENITIKDKHKVFPLDTTFGDYLGETRALVNKAIKTNADERIRQVFNYNPFGDEPIPYMSRRKRGRH